MEKKKDVLDVLEKKRLIVEVVNLNDVDPESVLRDIDQTFNAFAEYVKLVNEQENFIRILANLPITPEQFQASYAKIDGRRRIIHNACMSGISFMNNVCALHDLPFKIFDGDISDRHAIADFIMHIVSETFESRMK